MGNYVACKKYTQKEKNQFIHLTRSHFSLIAKNCVGLGIGTLTMYFLNSTIRCNQKTHVSNINLFFNLKQRGV